MLYELQSDGLRLSLPVPQDKVCQAAVNDTKLVKPLYDSIGEDFAGLKKHITDIVSAGFASGASYGDMANQITGKMIGNYATLRGGALGRAKLIVRTEGNRIANAARLEAAKTRKAETIEQLANAKTEVLKPFAFEEELKEKTERLNALNIELNLDEKDTSVLDTEPEQGEEQPERKSVSRER